MVLTAEMVQMVVMVIMIIEDEFGFEVEEEVATLLMGEEMTACMSVTITHKEISTIIDVAAVVVDMDGNECEVVLCHRSWILTC